MSKFTRRSVVLVALAGLSLGALAAAASAALPDGDYLLTVPGVGEVNFTIEEGNVTTVVAPDGYGVEDDDEHELELKTSTDATEIELKSGKIEIEGVAWTEEPELSLELPDGGVITVTYEDGAFVVTVPDGWLIFPRGDEWLISDTDLEDLLGSGEGDEVALPDGAVVFKLEIDEDGVELKAVDEVDDDFRDHESRDDDDHGRGQDEDNDEDDDHDDDDDHDEDDDD